ncbi:hypothetical protein GUJ93_ZPchr0013g37393 [Zizania palustris]|uniref:Bifunctional inhibitor/plant lipid transfer protein/seed storage helical domain-containing protein n=1 Tax=Zizania palustris TaxID=103762 RepID=A0A8J5WV89_ZIZPA|nr:hypothetical protein GUJ93_ZPchr0013g37393 [Zizania palustris]
MERSHITVLIGLLAFSAGVSAAAAATVGGATTAESACEPTILATQVSLFCAPDMPTAQCCEPVVASVDLGGGVPCLCRVAAEPQLIISGLNATHLLTLYIACGGLRPGGARLAAACEGPAPLAAVVGAPPPPPAGPRRKQPAREAPPPRPATEKLSPPPQPDGRPSSPAIPLTPAFPIMPPPPRSDAASSIKASAAAIFLLIAAAA